MSLKSSSRRESEVEDTTIPPAFHLDDVLENWVQPLGFWQWKVYFLVCIPLLSPFVFFSAFTTLVPPHTCQIPTDNNISSNTFDNVTNNMDEEALWHWIPRKSSAEEPPMIGQIWQPCLEYTQWQSYDEMPNYPNDNSNNQSASSAAVQSCSRGMWFNSSSSTALQGTVTQYFQLVCNRQHLLPLENSLFMMGRMLSGLITGILADLYGRRRVILFSTVICFLCSLLLSCSVNFTMYIIVRCLLGIASLSMFCIAFVLISEITTAKYRNIFAVLLCASSGLLARPYLALATRLFIDWRWVNLCLAACCLPVVFFYHCLPESPRWLFSVGRNEEAMAILHGAMLQNHAHCCRAGDGGGGRGSDKSQQQRPPAHPDTTLTEEWNAFLKQKVISAPLHSKKSVWQLLTGWCTSREMVKRILLACFWRFHENLVYYGLTFYAVKMPGDAYLAFIVAGLISLPGNAIQSLVYYRYGRKWPLFIVTVTKAALLFVCLALQWTSSSAVWVMGAVVQLAMMFMECGVSMTFTYLPELFPTEIRNHSLGVTIFAANIGSAVAPFIIQLDLNIWKPLPLFVFAVISSLAALAVCFLPETKYTPILDKIEQLKTPERVTEVPL